MKLGETTAALRRILLTIQLADGSDLAMAVEALTPTIQVAQNDTTLIAATGSLHSLSSEPRQHYYEASAAEALVPGFLLVIISHASIQTAIVWAPVGQIFALGETAAAKLRLPLTIYDDSSPPALATGATVTTGSDLQSSINGGEFADDAGSLVEIGSGAYYWQATAASAATAGFVEVRYESTGFGLCLSWVSVDEVSTTPTPEPTPEPGPAAILAPTSGDDVTLPIDHVQAALDRLPQQYRELCNGKTGETNTQKLIRVLMSPAADLENALLAVLAGRNVDTAVGFMLDLLGKLVGRPRNGVTDDELYRRYVKAQISANKSDGLIEDILTIARLVVSNDDASIVLYNDGAAAYTVAVEGVATTVEVATVLAALVIRATAAGVRAIIQWSSSPPEETFRYDVGPGYDVGHYADATDTPL